MERVRLDPEWKRALAAEFQAPYMVQLRAFLEQEKRTGKSYIRPALKSSMP